MLITKFIQSDYNLPDLTKLRPRRLISQNNSGQMLIITSLVVVLMLISTVVYVTDIEKNAPVFVADGNSDLSAVKQVGVNTLISALANISMTENQNVLNDDLNLFKSAVENHCYNSISELQSTPLNSATFSNGIYLDWNNDGNGTSSISVLFALNSTGNTESYYSEYAITVTSSIKVNGTYTSLNDSQAQVTLSCNVLNEGKPALAEKLILYYQQNGTNWIPVTPSNINDFDNGTYTVSFLAQNINQSIPLPVSVNCIDTRAISIWTNTTCPQNK